MMTDDRTPSRAFEMHVKIYIPSKSATQSGRGKTNRVTLEPDRMGARRPESLMGWVSSPDTLNQLRLGFDTVEAAVDYATRQGWTYTVLPGAARRVKPRNYTDNFKSTLTIEALKSRNGAQESC
jgi:hypothetical protein